MLFNKRRERIKMLNQLHFTSKAALKQQCLFIADGSTKEARELYEFLIEDMPDLPAVDPVPPTWQASTRDTVNGVMGWLRENQSTLTQAAEYLRGLFSRNAAAVERTAEALPEIN